MRKNVILYYLLVLLVVMGAFAAMALNSYGVVLMSYATLGFGLLFLYELIFLLPKLTPTAGENMKMIGLELLTLSVWCLLYASRGLMISVPFGDEVPFVLLAVLFAGNVFSLLQTGRRVKGQPANYKIGLVSYFVSLILLVAAMYFKGATVMYISTAAVLCLVVFVLSGRRRVIIEGEETSAIQEALRFRNKSGIQLIGFGLIIAYSSLNALNLLPSLYFGAMPNGYSKVVSQQGRGNAMPDPKAFEEAYKRFVKGR